MDPGGVGALIGIAGLLGILLCIKVYDLIKQRKKTVNSTIPHLVKMNPTFVVRQHSKMKMILPK
jgi:hypothetical protein